MSRLALAGAAALALATAVPAQHTAKVHAIAYSPAGKLVVTGGEDGRLVTWDAATGALVSQTRVGRRPWAIRDLAFAPQGDWVVAGGGDRVKVFRAGATKPRLDLEVPGDVATVGFGPFLRLAYYSTSGLAAVQGGLNGTWYRRSQLPAGQVWAADLSPDGSLVALGFDSEHEVHIYRAATGELVREVQDTFSRSISALAFSPDGSKLAVGGYDHRVRVFDVGSGARLAYYEAHPTPVYALAWSPDGSLLASGAKAGEQDGPATVTLALQTWQGERRGTESPRFTVEALAFSPDGGTIAYAGSSSRVGLWRPTRPAPAPAPVQ